MGDLYRNMWADHDCVTAAWRGLLFIVPILIGLWGMVAVPLWLSVRNSPAEGRDPAMRLLWKILGGVAAVLVLGVGYFALADTDLRRVTVEPPILTVQWCDGLTERLESHSFDEITGIRYRRTVQRGRTSQNTHDLVVAFQDGETLAVPLSTDPERMNPDVLHAFVPREVIAPWTAFLRQRGVHVPEGL
jgi:hypothetical protein